MAAAATVAAGSASSTIVVVVEMPELVVDGPVEGTTEDVGTVVDVVLV
jgi:hypothetical protein